MNKKTIPLATWFITIGMFSLATVWGQTKYRPGIKHVIVIGVDGMGSENVWRAPYNNIPAPQVPIMDSLITVGAWTKEAAIDALNFSGPNWNGMVTGSLSSEHGVTSNSCTNGNGLETIYKVLRDQNPNAEIGVIYEWDIIGCYPESGVVDFDSDVSANETQTAIAVVNYLTSSKPDFLFVHIDTPDGAGHSSGGNSQEYVDVMESVDAAIGTILTGLKGAGMQDSTLVIIIADHGHHPTSGAHSGSDKPVPFIVAGPGIIPGEVTDSVRNNQIAPVVAYALGLTPSTDWSAEVGAFEQHFATVSPILEEVVYQENSHFYYDAKIQSIVYSGTELGTIKIFNAQGYALGDFQLTKENPSIQWNNLPKGFYSIQLDNGFTTYQQRIILP